MKIFNSKKLISKGFLIIVCCILLNKINAQDKISYFPVENNWGISAKLSIKEFERFNQFIEQFSINKTIGKGKLELILNPLIRYTNYNSDFTDGTTVEVYSLGLKTGINIPFHSYLLKEEKIFMLSFVPVIGYEYDNYKAVLGDDKYYSRASIYYKDYYESTNGSLHVLFHIIHVMPNVRATLFLAQRLSLAAEFGYGFDMLFVNSTNETYSSPSKSTINEANEFDKSIYGNSSILLTYYFNKKNKNEKNSY